MNPIFNDQIAIVDASFIIALSDTTNLHYQTAVQIYESHINKNIHLICNTVTFSEFAIGILRTNRVIPEVFTREIVITPIPSNSWNEIALLRIQTGLKTPDCIVLWQAEYSQAADILTFDQKQYQKFLQIRKHK